MLCDRIDKNGSPLTPFGSAAWLMSAVQPALWASLPLGCIKHQTLLPTEMESLDLFDKVVASPLFMGANQKEHCD